ncbi:MAG: methylenetetrahydrofolate reductase [Limnospira sp. PMC 1291.21]|uniref:Methylenetetrahydrofolate reductase n=2 Tax=Limnospira TaxID=2596745 RepID=A0A9P1KGX4_9CYAN|nr:MULTISPECIES: methylenetetrahydrofolate reductase [Limnospira]EKD07892.1 methylenetetrahydrofolate reductase [Arthrospira platensis C1]MDC0839170.1 methylenetetrahydrofolate reductase [Limnoraphis robusta]MDY7054174.1 methylenetetrahydrofolate reductase [Limnospira fusiformis LS22]QJB25448.1 methylenetetrahydrofolate reductase [Limnospira fusiformis SAG 85.79]RAQ39407.1 methylenetetrahydrofolate reductase [Arthrospira sp. O9.13F]
MNRFRTACLNPKEFVITAEVAPPKGGDPTHMIEMARGLKNRVHGVNITDGSRAVLGMSSLASCVILQHHGIEPILQVACRDRNRIGLQADLLGAHALGIRNILALTGDPVKAGDHVNAKPVFDFESVRLLQAINKLNNGMDWNDKKLPHGRTDLFPGAAVDPQSPSFSGLQSRFYRKLKAGACFFQSQLITDFERLYKFMNQVASDTDKPILAGIFLLKSAKNALFINKYVPGVNIPDHIIHRLEKSSHPLEEGIKIAAEQVQIARQICRGVHLMAVKREDLIPKILDAANIPPLP